MRSLLSAIALACCVSTAPVAAAPAEIEEAVAPLPEVDPASVALAREFVDLLYPGTAQDWVDSTREEWLAATERFESVSIRTRAERDVTRYLARLEPIMLRQVPVLMNAYAEAYARNYSPGELRELIAFARTSTGQKFLENQEFADYDPAVVAAQSEMSEEMGPLLEELQTSFCQRATEVRIAAGETDATCARA